MTSKFVPSQDSSAKSGHDSEHWRFALQDQGMQNRLAKGSWSDHGETTEGILRFPASSLFVSPKLAVWRQVPTFVERFSRCAVTGPFLHLFFDFTMYIGCTS